MSVIVLDIAVIVILVVINGVFSMSELAVMTAKRVRLENRAERGDRGAAAAMALAEHPTPFLSTVQVGITLVGVLTGAFGGATITSLLSAELERIPWIGDRSEGVALAIVVLAITYLSLILGELVPKRIALSNPERVAAVVARPMTLLARVGRPFVTLLTASTNLVTRLLHLGHAPAPGLTEDEIHAVIEQGAEAGVVPMVEHEIVESVFRLGDRAAEAIMTPRTQIEWVDVRDDEATVRAQIADARRQWFLVCDGSVETIVGVAHAGDLLARLLHDRPFDLRAVATEPLYVPTPTPVFRLLELFRTSRAHVAIVLDEYGGVDGLVTLDDILGELVGEIPRGAESEIAPPLRHAGGSVWFAQGTAMIDEIMDELEIHLDPAADRNRDFHTVGGLLLTRIGRIPVVGDVLDWGGYRWTVELMAGRRVERVRITPEPTRKDAP